jgi:hypothetical protein
MRFLLRMAFWLGLVLVLLPSGGSQPASKSDISTGEAISAAKAAVGDMQQFCERQREACTVGSQAALAIGHRAQAGARMLYEFLNDQLGPNDTGATGAVSEARATQPGKAVPLPLARPSQNTLTPADLLPAWRGPQPRREASGDNPA